MVFQFRSVTSKTFFELTNMYLYRSSVTVKPWNSFCRKFRNKTFCPRPAKPTNYYIIKIVLNEYFFVISIDIEEDLGYEEDEI